MGGGGGVGDGKLVGAGRRGVWVVEAVWVAASWEGGGGGVGGEGAGSGHALAAYILST